MEDHAMEKDGRRDQCVFVGDTGERDEQAGEFIAKYPRNLKAVFLHVVSMNPNPARSRFKRPLRRERPHFLLPHICWCRHQSVKGLSVDGLQSVVDQAMVVPSRRTSTWLNPTCKRA